MVAKEVGSESGKVQCRVRIRIKISCIIHIPIKVKSCIYPCPSGVYILISSEVGRGGGGGGPGEVGV